MNTIHEHILTLDALIDQYCVAKRVADTIKTPERALRVEKELRNIISTAAKLIDAETERHS